MFQNSMKLFGPYVPAADYCFDRGVDVIRLVPAA